MQTKGFFKSFGASPGHLDPTVPFLLDAESLRDLESSGSFVIDINPDDPSFNRKTAILVKKIEIRFLNTRKRPVLPINYKVTHSGYHAFRDSAGRRLDFASQERHICNEMLPNGRFQLEQSFVAEGDARFLADNGDYVGVCPLTRWKVELDGPPAAVLAQIRSIEMRFVGTARG